MMNEHALQAWRPEIVAAFAKWEEDRRKGLCRPEDDDAPIEEIASEMADAFVTYLVEVSE